MYHALLKVSFFLGSQKQLVKYQGVGVFCYVYISKSMEVLIKEK